MNEFSNNTHSLGPIFLDFLRTYPLPPGGARGWKTLGCNNWGQNAYPVR